MSIIIAIFLALGIFFFVVGVVGLLRLPDVYSRMHATTKCDTLGAGMILVGLMLYHGIAADSAKLAIIIMFILLTNPASAHVVAKAAYQNKMPMAEGSFELDLTGEDDSA